MRLEESAVNAIIAAAQAITSDADMGRIRPRCCDCNGNP